MKELKPIGWKTGPHMARSSDGKETVTSWVEYEVTGYREHGSAMVEAWRMNVLSSETEHIGGVDV